MEYVFKCPACSVEIPVDEPVRADLLVTGCVVCESEVSDVDFL